MKPIKILIADGGEARHVRRIIEREPDMQVCDTAVTGRQAVMQAEKLVPDVVMLDIGMPELNGVDAARRIRRLLPTTEVLIFTAHETDELIRQSFEAGAKSYILKSEAPSCLVPAIRSLNQHKPFYTDRTSKVIFSRFRHIDLHHSQVESSSPKVRLSVRERKVIKLLAEGKSNKQVATRLGVSLRKAESHRTRVMQKLGVDSLDNLVRYAIRNRIVQA